MVIKKWAKTHGINEAKDGTLSSYALTLMTIHFLQCGCKPPVLPSLQQMFPDFFSDDGNVQDLMKLDVQKFFQERNISRSQNVESLGELLLGFFQYFSNTFSWSSSVISVRLGRVYSTEFGVLPKNKYIYIEEPFDSNNVAKTVYNSENFNKIKMKISLAANKLRVSPSLKSII
ncbi:poly(A) RNA polymerase GLD2-A-like [Exaiptasia diaphana]|uniref:PAP-associated domain-containing protein n=1 Tax=Exaiptasia diaphana TaxID=2652724 RepID=A0A913YBB6_EXADI|nr:poly(A) RNA polymerase GLD2-A-like [Exaiptasia diaphana]